MHLAHVPAFLQTRRPCPSDTRTTDICRLLFKVMPLDVFQPLFLRIPSGAISAHDFSKATAVARRSLRLYPVITCEDEGIELVQCPPYVRGWILRERAEEA
jgi:hypothetical protein